MNTTQSKFVKEIIIYTIAAIAGLTVFGYSIHMFIGGLVSPETEIAAITIGCIVAAVTMALMAWDIVRQRKKPRQ